MSEHCAERSACNARKRWHALTVLCLGVLMIVFDATIVNVAMPSIRADLGFSQIALVWVVNAYLLTFGGFMLLGGRLGDLFGHRRTFLFGIALFTCASLACGLARSQGLLIGARAVQGLAGALVSPVALSLIMHLFAGAPERAKAMGIYAFVSAGGGSIGLLLGGFLINTLNWHWVFLINLPIGAVVYALGLSSLPDGRVGTAGRLDIAGAVIVTTSLMLALYAIVNSNEVGWNSAQTLVPFGSAAALLILFLSIEARVLNPLMPLGVFRLRNLTVASVVSVLWSVAMFAWGFNSTLYLQLVLGCSPLQVGLAFLPTNLIMAMFSLGVSARVVRRFGIKPSLAIGQLLAAAGIVLFARAPVAGSMTTDVFPGMLLLGVGSGIAFSPLLLAAMSGVGSRDSGLASGVLTTAAMMGGAIGLATLVSIAAVRTNDLLASGADSLAALNGGYHVAFIVGAVCAAAAALIGAVFFRIRETLDPRLAASVSSVGTGQS